MEATALQVCPLHFLQGRDSLSLHVRGVQVGGLGVLQEESLKLLQMAVNDCYVCVALFGLAKKGTLRIALLQARGVRLAYMQANCGAMVGTLHANFYGSSPCCTPSWSWLARVLLCCCVDMYGKYGCLTAVCSQNSVV